MWKITSVASRGASAASAVEVRRQVALDHARRVARGRPRPRRAASSTRCSCPGQISSSSQRICSGSVTSIGLRSSPARHDDLRQRGGQRRVALRHAAQDRRAVAEPVAGVVVAVAVGQQAQPGARADLEQRERLRQRGEQRQHQRAAGGLVGLRAALEHHRLDLAAPLAQPLAGTRPTRPACPASSR